MRFRIDLKIFIFLIIFYFTKQIEIYAMIMFFALIHELGHLIAGLLMGMKPEKIELMPFGVSISFKIKVEEYNKKIKKGNKLEVKKILVALAGPLTNFIIIVITTNINLDIFKSLMIIYTNFLIMIFNLLPIYPLDGGRILKGILHINCCSVHKLCLHFLFEFLNVFHNHLPLKQLLLLLLLQILFLFLN